VCEQLQHLQLSGGEAFELRRRVSSAQLAHELLDHSSCDAGREQGVSRRDDADGFDELLGGAFLSRKPLGEHSGLDRLGASLVRRQRPDDRVAGAEVVVGALVVLEFGAETE